MVKKKKVKYRRKSLWTKCKEKDRKILYGRGKKKMYRRMAGRVTDVPERDMPWRSLEDGSLLLGHKCRRCSGRFAWKDGNDENNAATGSSGRGDQAGETEVPHTIIVSDAVKGTKVDLDGKGHHVKRMKEIPQSWKQPKEQTCLK